MKKEHLAHHPYQWFCTPSLLHSGTAYHPGNYLRNIHWMLHAVGGFSLAIMIFFFFAQAFSFDFTKSLSVSDLLNLISPAVIIAAILIYFVAQINRQGSFRRILESEMLSIQTGAVVWRIVITCHILAVVSAFKRHKSYMYYTHYCSSLAADFNRHFYEPHNWLSKWELLGTPVTETTFQELEKIIPHLPDHQEVTANPGVSPLMTAFVNNVNHAVFNKNEPPTGTINPPSPTNTSKAESSTEKVF